MGIAHDLIPIVQALAAADPVVLKDSGEVVCPLCGASGEHLFGGKRTLVHAEGCPWVRACAEIEGLERLVGDAGECASCKAPITWIVMTSGKRMPVDQRRLSITTKDGRTVTGWESHFATCVGAGQHRKRR